MTDEQIDALLSEFRPLTQEPGALKRRLKDESAEIKTGVKRVSRSKDKAQKLIASLFGPQ